MSRKISETDFATQVEYLLRQFRWRFMHIKPAKTGFNVWVSRMNPEGKGWLDYLALRPPRVLVIELKDATSQMTPEQEEWWADWKACQRAFLCEPMKVLNWLSGKAVIELAGKISPSFSLSPELYLWRPKDIEPEGGKILEVLR